MNRMEGIRHCQHIYYILSPLTYKRKKEKHDLNKKNENTLKRMEKKKQNNHIEDCEQRLQEWCKE